MASSLLQSESLDIDSLRVGFMRLAINGMPSTVCRSSNSRRLGHTAAVRAHLSRSPATCVTPAKSTATIAAMAPRDLVPALECVVVLLVVVVGVVPVVWTEPTILVRLIYLLMIGPWTPKSGRIILVTLLSLSIEVMFQSSWLTLVPLSICAVI